MHKMTSIQRAKALNLIRIDGCHPRTAVKVVKRRAIRSNTPTAHYGNISKAQGFFIC